MNLEGAELEPSIPVGNHYPKYHTKNPIARWLVNGFLDSFRELSRSTDARDALEVGCGEGHLSAILAGDGRSVRGIDISPAIIEQARSHPDNRTNGARFEVGSVYDLSADSDAAELVVCCEVMEHLEDPDRALSILARLARPYLLVSVPREPIWRMLNMARGRYLGDLGNTPGHVQHWSQRRFLDLLSRHVDVIAVRTPLPWTMALCRARPTAHDPADPR